MKRWICVALILSLLLCGCQTQAVPAETAPSTALPAETMPPETTEQAWTGFTGSLEGYIYLHEKERDKKWEEDILFIAQDFLDNHPWLVDDTTRTYEVESYISTPDWEWKSQYIPEKREAFLAEVNALLPLIPAYESEQLIWEIQRILAGIGECHANLFVPTTKLFPLSYYPFYENEELVIRVVSAPESKDHLLYCRLTAINGIPVEEILDRMRPYCSCDAYSGFLTNATIQTSAPIYLSEPTLLQAIGVIAPDARNADFTFLTESGKTISQSISAMSIAYYNATEITDHTIITQFPYSFSPDQESVYWIDYKESDSTLYIRLNAYDADLDAEFKETNKKIYSILNSAECMNKIILDLRQNGGGSPPSALAGLLNFLRNPKVRQVYVLIDGGAFSMAVIASYNIRTEIPAAIFVGTPTGQGLPTGSVREPLTTPHHGLMFRTPGGMSVLESGESFEYFEPDILVYQTLEDYKQGIDTVLQYVLDRE